jgi:hypothetical protein
MLPSDFDSGAGKVRRILSGIAILIWSGVGLAFVQANVTKLMEEERWNLGLTWLWKQAPNLSGILEYRLLWFIVGLVSGITIGFWIISLLPQNRSRKRVSKTENIINERSIVEPEIVPSYVTPKYLADFFVNNTDLNATNETKNFIGKRMLIEGKVVSVNSASGNTAFIHVKPDEEIIQHIYMDFDEKWLSELTRLKGGEHIKAIGRLSRIDGLEIALDRCELASVV